MYSQLGFNRLRSILIASIFLLALPAMGQSKAYQRKRAAPKMAPANAPSSATESTATDAPTAAKSTSNKRESEKLDIQELEQKYWAPKDTDFSVVQNRTYTKAGRIAASLLTGPVINDPFNSGLATALSVNYYVDERYGFELMYQTSSLSDSDATDSFKEFAGGGTRPDFNRDVGFYGIGVNWVPFYAKMSFLGKKIIYFDMQVTPFLGMTTYEQQSQVSNPEESAFSYGIDVTQYFFFSTHWAVRANLHSRFYTQDVLAYTNGAGIFAGQVKRSGEATSSSYFLMGVTYFF